MTDDTDDRLVLPKQFEEQGVPYSNMHRRRLEAAGLFPKRVHISAKIYGYVYSELVAWRRARIAERGTPQAEASRAAVTRAAAAE